MYVLLIIAIYSDSCVEKTLIYYPHITKKCDICDMIQIETIFDILVKGFIIRSEEHTSELQSRE